MLYVIALVDKTLLTLDLGKVTIGYFIDHKRAFETFNHFIVINKFRRYDIYMYSYILDCFVSYLDNRKQHAVYSSSKSNFIHVSCGDQQGSILGHLLFILYINDVQIFLNHRQINILFAHSTTLII